MHAGRDETSALMTGTSTILTPTSQEIRSLGITRECLYK